MSEVAATVGYYRNQKEFKTYLDEEEKRIQQEMLKRAGMTR